MGEFRCRDSGKCCQLTHIQVGITVGDLIRLSERENIPIKKLLQEWVSLNPFATDQEYVYEYELGITMPCSFRIAGKCSVYGARPLNCRLFPYWILAKFPPEKIREIIDPSYRCIHETVLTKERKARYKEYSDQLGKILLHEADITDRMILDLGFRRILNMKGATEAQEAVLKRQYQGIELAKKIEELRIAFCRQNLKKEDYQDLPEKVAAYIVQHDIKKDCATWQQLDRIESLRAQWKTTAGTS